MEFLGLLADQLELSLNSEKFLLVKSLVLGPVLKLFVSVAFDVDLPIPPI